MAKYLSGRSKLTPLTGLSSDRYRYLSVSDSEPNLGDPLVGSSSVIAKPIVPGPQYIIVAVDGYPGERYWIQNQGGIIPGSISIFKNTTLIGGLSSTTQLILTGAAVSATGYVNPDGSPGVGVTITIFSPGSQGQVIFNNNNDFKGASSLFYDNSTNYVGVGTTTTPPTQELQVNGNLRLTGTLYDYNNNPGSPQELLIKNNFGGLTWVNQSTIRAGAGGTVTNVQYHNNAGLVDGADNFVFDYTNSRVGIGSTLPTYLFDVLGYSRFTGQTEIDYLKVGIATIATLGVTGLTTTRDLSVTGFSTFTNTIDANGGAYIDNIRIGITNDNTIDTSSGNLTLNSADGTIFVDDNLTVTGITSVGFITATTGFIGILTANVLDIIQTNIKNLNVTGIATIATLGVSGLTTTRYLKVIGITTTDSLEVTNGTLTKNLKVTGIATFEQQVSINTLNVSGVGTFDNIELEGNTVSTTTGNLILDSASGITRIDDALYINDATESDDKDSGSIYTEGGVGIEKNLNVGGQLSIVGVTTLASNGGITTTGGALYVKGSLYVRDDIFYDELFARNGTFTGIVSTKYLNVSGVATIATLGVTGLTTTRDLSVTGFSTFTNTIDANGGAYIDNIRIGITNDNTIDTSSGNLTLNSADGTTTISSDLIVSDTATFNSTVTLGNDASDVVNFTSKVATSILPSTTSLNLGSSSNKWDTVYANTFEGRLSGYASSIAVSSDSTNLTRYLPFVDVTAGLSTVRTNSSLSYNPSTNILATSNLAVSGISSLNNLTVSGVTTIGNAFSDIVYINSTVGTGITPNSNASSGTDATGKDLGGTSNYWRKIYAKEFVGAIAGNADTATRLSTPREIDISGDVTGVGIGTTFDGSQNVNIQTILSNSGVTANTYGSSTTVPVFAVDVKGRVTSVTNTPIDVSAATVSKADSIKTVASSATLLYPTFVDSNNNPADYESVYTDDGISYNASTNSLSVSGNLTVSGTSTFNGDVDFGNGSSDTVTFTSRVDSSILPSTNASSGTDATGKDLGGTSNYWRKIYAKEFVGAITGNADSASKLSIPRNIGITGDLTWSVNFDGSGNVSSGGTLANSGVTANTYGSSTTVPVFAVDVKGRVTSVTNTTIDVSGATVSKADAATQLSPRSSSPYTTIDAQGSYIHWNRTVGDGSTWLINQKGAGGGGFLFAESTSSASNVNGGTVGLTTTLKLDSSGNITGYGLLTIPSIKPTRIQDTSGGTGTDTHVLTANGSGGWSWKVVGNISGASASIAVSEDSSNLTRYLPFVDSISGITTVRTKSTLVYNPSGIGSVGIATNNPKATLDVGSGNLRISSGDVVVNGTLFLSNTRTSGGGFWSNGGLDGNVDINNVTPGGGVGLAVKLPGGTSGTIDSPQGTGSMYRVLSAKFDNALSVGIVTVQGHILPSISDTYNLGSSSNRWNDFYVNDIIGAAISGADIYSNGVTATSGPLQTAVLQADGNIVSYRFTSAEAAPNNTYPFFCYGIRVDNIEAFTTEARSNKITIAAQNNRDLELYAATGDVILSPNGTGNHVLPRTTNAVSLGVNGNVWSAVWVNGGVLNGSDQRDKTDITSSVLGLNFIQKLNPVSYKWIVGRNESILDEEGNEVGITSHPGKRTHYGLLSQEVKTAFDECGAEDFAGWVLTDLEDPDSQQALNYSQFISPMIKAIQEQQGTIDQLTTTVNSLLERIELLENPL